MNIWEKDLYKVLQVSPEATVEVINSAFRALAAKYHTNSPENDPDKFKEVTEAYEILGNPVKRKEYDSYRLNPKALDLPPIFPTFEKSSVTIQSVINLLYEQINFENVNHNPTKSRIYQEIYNEVTSNRSKIETTNAYNNPIWKIIKTYKSYLSVDEFNGLKLMISKVFKLTEEESDTILKSIDTEDIPFKKLYKIVIFVFVVSLLGIIVAYFAISRHGTDNYSVNNESDQNQEVTNASTSEDKIKYYAKIYDIGMPINIRSAPSVEWNNIVSKFSPGDKVEVLKHEPNGWYLIKKGDVEGYIYGGLLTENNYTDSFAVGQIIPAEIKVVDRGHKVFKILKEKDRFVIFYHDNENYYIESEKGNLIGIKKEDLTLENPQDTTIPYIEDSVKQNVEYFAVSSNQTILENNDSTKPTEEETEVINSTAPIISPENPRNRPNYNKVETIVPPVIFPGNNKNTDQAINNYVQDVKSTILNNWKAPGGLSNYSSVVVFRVARDGRLLNFKLLQSAGNKMVDTTSIEAIKLSAPFKPLPDNYENDYVDIQFNFDDKSR